MREPQTWTVDRLIFNFLFRILQKVWWINCLKPAGLCKGPVLTIRTLHPIGWILDFAPIFYCFVLLCCCNFLQKVKTQVLEQKRRHKLWNSFVVIVYHEFVLEFNWECAKFVSWLFEIPIIPSNWCKLLEVDVSLNSSLQLFCCFSGLSEETQWNKQITGYLPVS